MSRNIDSFTVAGLAFLGAGVMLAAYVGLEPDAASDAPRERTSNGQVAPPESGTRSTSRGQTQPASRTNPREPPAATPTAKPAPPQSRSGWIPARSRESVSAADVPTGIPRAGARCSESVDPVEIGKQAGAVVAEQVRAAGRIPTAEERALGDKLELQMSSVPRFRGKLDLSGDVTRYGGYLQSLVDELAQHSTRKNELRFRVHVIRDPSFNAFALPGGVLGVHTGLLAGPSAVRDEAELVMVLAHEIAHVELRHPLAAYEAARAVLGSGAQEAAVISQMLQMPISSEYEHQSDRRGIALAVLSQYDPAAAARLWRRQAEAQPKTKGPAGILGTILGSAERILATHPPSAHRCARTRQIALEYARAPRWQRYYRGATNLRDRVPGRRAPH